MRNGFRMPSSEVEESLVGREFEVVLGVQEGCGFLVDLFARSEKPVGRVVSLLLAEVLSTMSEWTSWANLGTCQSVFS